MLKTVSAAVLGLCVAVGPVAAFADQPRPGMPGEPHPGGVSNAAQCAAGFTANPGTINGGVTTGQFYTCTGPAIVCSATFKPEDTADAVIPEPGQLVGKTIYGSPVTIKGGRMVYTCAQPPSPAQ